MTGTSIDALDGAAVRIEGSGLSARARLLAHVTVPLGALTPRLRSLASGAPTTAGDIARLALDFAAPHVEAVERLRALAGAPDLVAVHGQTVFHAPPASWQMLNPWPIAGAAGCPLVYDLRGADLSAGGQGAPITPLADWLLFRDASETRAIVNLGGFCNATILPGGAEAFAKPDAVGGLDVCACNHVLDEAARRALGAPYDAGGAAALAGAPHADASATLAQALGAQSRSGRSLGTGDESWRWIDTWLPRLSAPDLVATACDALGRTIAGALAPHAVRRLFCAGGGARNLALLGAIARHAGARAGTTAALGVPPEAREAMEIAALGALCADGVPITLPRVTRLPANTLAPISGAWIGRTAPTPR